MNGQINQYFADLDRYYDSIGTGNPVPHPGDPPASFGGARPSVQSRRAGSGTRPSVPSPVASVPSPVARAASGRTPVTDFLKSGQAKRWGAIGGTLAAVYGAYLGVSALFGGDKEAEYLSASWLGKRGNRLEEALFDETEQFDARTMATIRGGTHFHEMIQEIFELEGAETEVKIVDKSLGVKGYVDVLLPGNIPVEVKTISSTGFDRLGRPLEAHTSQVNFYMHGRQSQYGYVVYLDGMDISRRKVFRVGYQPGRLIADVEEARNRMLSHPNRMTNDNIKWLTQTHSMDPAYLRGIRHSSGHASSFDSIKPSAEFPGGRVSSIDQASKYRDLGNVDHTPTMGLTIRKHETAIGHRSRGNSTKRVGGQNHANGSRRYR